MNAGKTPARLLRNVLLGLLCASVLLGGASCTDSGGQTGTTESQSLPVSTGDGQDQVNTGDPIGIVMNQESDYSIIYPADCISVTRDVYVELKNSIRTATGCSMNMIKDSDPAVGEREILIGRTSRPESAEAMDKLGENQFSFTLSGGKIVIVASDDACMKLAVQTFVERFATSDGLIVHTDDFPVTYACGVNYQTVTVDNTADIEADDPYVVEHDGYYYYCWSENGVKVTRLKSLAKITKEGGKQVFRQQSGNFERVFAPELHYIDGAWYIYVAMCVGSQNDDDHRMYCLKGTTQDPTDPFELVGQLTDPTDKWAIDGTVFRYKGELYTVWSGWEGDVNVCQNLYIAHMSNPWTIDSKRVMISTPTTWDNNDRDPQVNEGPFPLVVGDTVHILFSGNNSMRNDYCVGYVTFSGGDILLSRNWKKSRTAFLTESPEIYGPGHCSVVRADDGSYQIVYHANLEPNTGWFGRSVRIQEISVTEEGIKLVKRRALKSELKIAEKYVIGPVES